MTRAALVTRVVKPALYIAAVLPLAYIAIRLGAGRVEGDRSSSSSTSPATPCWRACC
ncbi:MAG: hypothetical protein H0X69_12575 [Gemmatimonadales bacterium]|nr:hypothetical protein [Gemmatimonadales bacterium]